MDIEKEVKGYKNKMKRKTRESKFEETYFDLIAFAFAAIFGYTLDRLKLNLTFIGLGYFSLGLTGGVLVGALILAYISDVWVYEF